MTQRGYGHDTFQGFCPMSEFGPHFANSSLRLHTYLTYPTRDHDFDPSSLPYAQLFWPRCDRHRLVTAQLITRSGARVQDAVYASIGKVGDWCGVAALLVDSSTRHVSTRWRYCISVLCLLWMTILFLRRFLVHSLLMPQASRSFFLCLKLSRLQQVRGSGSPNYCQPQTLPIPMRI